MNVYSLASRRWIQIIFIKTIFQNTKFRYSFICQDTSIRRQRSDLSGLRASCHLLLPV